MAVTLLVCSVAILAIGHARALSVPCSRQVSRDVRSVLTTQVLEPLGLSHALLPDHCLLRLGSDLFHQHEAHKTIAPRTGHHKCMYCNKTFRSEYYLDRHMDNKHMDELSPDNHFCLAELAPLLGVRERDAKRPQASGSFSYVQPANKCSAAILEKLNYQCAAIARSCFDTAPDGQARIDAFIGLVCTQLMCHRGQLVGIAKNFGDEVGEYSVMGLVWTIVQLLVGSVIVLGLSLYVWNSYPTWFQSALYNSRFREKSSFSRNLKRYFKFYKRE